VDSRPPAEAAKARTAKAEATAGAVEPAEATGLACAAAETDQAYFLAIEDFFVRLRGAPLMLSPADWHVARRWHRQGLPLGLVRRAIQEALARRRERGAKGYIGLRYCARAVEAAWVEHSELAAPGSRDTAPAFDAAARLRGLAAALPAGFSGVAALQARLAALASAELDAQTVEERLADLDGATLESALAALACDERAALDAGVEKAIAALGGRLPAAEVARARERLARQVLRGRLGLPTLSLFSPEAMAAEVGSPLGETDTARRPLEEAADRG